MKIHIAVFWLMAWDNSGGGCQQL